MLIIKKKAALGARSSKGILSESTTLFLMVLPFILFLIIFNYTPLLGWLIAFFRYTPGLPIFESQFIGIKYFLKIFSYGSDFETVMKNTLSMSFLQILTSPIPMLFAILLAEVRNVTVRKFIQIGTTLPNFISFIIVFSIFMSMFSFDDGFVNILLRNFKLTDKGINPMMMKELTWVFQAIIINIWKNLGWASIVYIAAMAGIAQELYEAAQIDGASRIQQTIHITIPSLIPTYLVLLILSIGHMLNGANFEQIFVFHNPVVAGAIETLDYYVYRVGLLDFNFSLSTAIGMFKSVISISLLFTVNAIGKKLLGRNVI